MIGFSNHNGIANKTDIAIPYKNINENSIIILFLGSLFTISYISIKILSCFIFNFYTIFIFENYYKIKDIIIHEFKRFNCNIIIYLFNVNILKEDMISI